jgi:hypothetical protein
LVLHLKKTIKQYKRVKGENKKETNLSKGRGL